MFHSLGTPKTECTVALKRRQTTACNLYKIRAHLVLVTGKDGTNIQLTIYKRSQFKFLYITLKKILKLFDFWLDWWLQNIFCPALFVWKHAARSQQAHILTCLVDNSSQQQQLHVRSIYTYGSTRITWTYVRSFEYGSWTVTIIVPFESLTYVRTAL
jgi:hypothetical protein